MNEKQRRDILIMHRPQQLFSAEPNLGAWYTEQEIECYKGHPRFNGLAGSDLASLLTKSFTLNNPLPIIVELNSQFHLGLRVWDSI